MCRTSRKRDVRCGALQTRDLRKFRILYGPGSALHRFALHRVRDTSPYFAIPFWHAAHTFAGVAGMSM